MERLTRTVVLDDGDILEAGTPATKELKAAIPNEAAWEDDGEESPRSTKKS